MNQPGHTSGIALHLAAYRLIASGRSRAMPIPRRPTGSVTAALDAIAALERQAAATDLDPLDRVMVDALAGLAEVMRAEGETLDALRRRMVRVERSARG